MQFPFGNTCNTELIEPKQQPESLEYFESIVKNVNLICKHSDAMQVNTTCNASYVQKKVCHSCRNLISVFTKKQQNKDFKLNNNHSMSTLQPDTTCLSFRQSLMMKAVHKSNTMRKERNYHSRESCCCKIAKTGTLNWCLENSSNFKHGDKCLSIPNNFQNEVPRLCNQINRKGLNYNKEVGNCVGYLEHKANTNISSTHNKRKTHIEKKINKRRKQIIVDQTPLRQISKTNKRRSELLDMSFVKVLHSSIGRISVTLFALAFVTLAAGSPSYGNRGK